MWILPKNYPLSSRFAQDMVASKEDLTCQGLNIESSLMWRSKPTPLQTWLRRWKPDSYLPHLFTRILKHSQRTCFEEKLTLSLEDTLASPLVQQESDLEKMTPDICGHTYGDTLNQLDLFGVSLKTSKDTSVLDCEKSLATWKASVMKQRGEYSQRVKLALRTRESECISWATPNTMDHLPQRSEEALIRQATTTRKGRSKPANLREQVNPTAVQIYQQPTSWPTATVFDVTGGSYPTQLANGAKLKDAVEIAEKMWPTPDVAQAQKVSNRPNYGQLGLANHPEVHGQTVDRPKMQKDRLGRQGQVKNNTNGNNQEQFGKLNPYWVEHLMGVPTGWTELGSWETELCHKQPLKHGSRSTKDSRH